MQVRPIRGEDIGRVADMWVELFEELSELLEETDIGPIREAIRSFTERDY